MSDGYLKGDSIGEICPIEKALAIIGSKWTPLIVRDLLREKNMRYGELMKSLKGISPKVLSERLKELEENKLVERKVYPEVPPKVEYKLTEKGRSLKAVFVELKKWGSTL